MPDFRGIPMWPVPPDWTTNYGIRVVLEAAEPNMTVGNEYQLFGIAVDNAAAPPKPYGMSFDDNDHFKLVELAKLKRATT